MDQRIQYARTTDGASIAYAAVGDGTPYIWIPSSLQRGTLLETGVMNAAPPALILRWATHFTVVRYDARGFGLSGAAGIDFSLDARLRDLGAVVAAQRAAPVILRGMADAAGVAIAYAATSPERVRALVLFGSYASGAALEASRPGMTAALTALVESNAPIGNQALVAMLAGHAAFVPDPDKMVSAAEVAALGRGMALLDVAQFLPKVQAPTLVIHGRQDAAVPIALGREVAAAIPDAQLYEYDGGHFVGPTTVDQVSQVISDFLGVGPMQSQIAGERADGISSPAFRTILFTDVVQNTVLLARIGDDAWHAVMREHEAIVRQSLKDHGGTEISTSGDGFFASFASASTALQCAIDMQRALATRNASAEHPVEIRIGLNAGEPIEHGDDLLGTAVSLANRIMAKASGRQILVADVVRQLVAGKNFSFSDAGDFVPKGFSDPVRMHNLRWRE
jgi:class 3 adenylate cyclase/pimeloyl-ACP methyl ester carboxylesterase